MARFSDVGSDEHDELAPIQNEVAALVSSQDGWSHLVSSQKYVYEYNMQSNESKMITVRS